MMGGWCPGSHIRIILRRVVAMLRRAAVIIGLIALGLALGGCTKCGPIWDDWMAPAKACKSDRL
jgi:hypothetical protein